MGEVVAELEDDELSLIEARAVVVEMAVALDPLAIGLLQGVELRRFVHDGLGGMLGREDEIPDLLPALPRVERFKLRVAHAPELRIRLRRLAAIALADELDDSGGVVHPLAQDAAQVAGLGGRDVLPLRFVAEPDERLRHDVARPA